ncbi:hypothetical protein [Desulfosporosinus sp. BICA1-9]|uniref:hypothetical protein n=1 Tax=Desulfosporosinus sp. BICA1-9 TaxID=1531958 RepID=UPI000ABF8063|nr:hypothetical protein [Desulfosporosinus sp. BICA1-9]
MNKQKWYSLIDKVYRVENLENAWKQVKANRGAAGVDLKWFEKIGFVSLLGVYENLCAKKAN